MANTVEARITGNAHFAHHLRTRLLRRACPAAREILSHMTDAELVAMYLKNEQRGREHFAKTRVQNLLNRAEKEAR